MNNTHSSTTLREPSDVRKKRELFRCWHRGTQEIDLILGLFAEEAVDSLDDAQLDRLEALIDCTDVDLFDWILGNSLVPAEHDHDVLRLLRGFSGARHQRPLQDQQHQS
jgi:antitoxin CptB